MNRFAAFDSDDEDTPKPAAPVVDKKKKKEDKPAKPAVVAQAVVEPAPAPAVTEAKKDTKPKGEKKPSNKSTKPPKTDAEPTEATGAGSAESGEVFGKSQAPYKGGHHRAPRTRYEKKQDETDPLIKPDNRIRGNARGFDRQKQHKNTQKEDANDVAKDTEKHPENVEAETADVTDTADVPETAEETPAEPDVPAEPEVVKLSFDEYQRIREEARAASAILTANKPERQVADSLAGLKVKETVKEEDAVYVGVTKTSKVTKAAQRSTGKTVFTDLAFKVDSPVETDRPRREFREKVDSPSGGRGGRGRGGGRGSGDRFKDTRSFKGPKIDIADTNAFPSL
eukprot:CAMPEP_0196762034 /NCGR_PEP_ID=MMETSP1095-20130614/1376_1 /TAXON_ID=96789 ORGANISM="Chromulina nebulosa, Strain UTEXLB2642" /NCGR_SAMPLE_ID=MMETSP1095 /ASSEMBLY_ACC=CAM_ASM_000446 /LENGTH=339 /DNA_ID=CAMNT_0042112279 /DNA_START=147 /DNA_END=1166 /DNA_ORIENTATION=-